MPSIGKELTTAPLQAPPLCINEEQIREAARIIEVSLRETLETPIEKIPLRGADH